MPCNCLTSETFGSLLLFTVPVSPHSCSEHFPLSEIQTASSRITHITKLPSNSETAFRVLAKTDTFTKRNPPHLAHVQKE